MERLGRERAGFSDFMLRFDDFFLDDLGPLLCSAGFGVLLAWIWLGLGDGVPPIVGLPLAETPVVTILLVSFSLVAAPLFLRPRFRSMLGSRAGLATGACLAAAGCLVLAGVRIATGGVYEGLPSVVARLAAIPVGAGTALLLFPFGVAFSMLRTRTAILALAFSGVTAVIVYFCASAFDSLAATCVVSSLLPLLAAVLLARSLPVVRDRLQKRPARKGVFASGYIQLVVAFFVYSFAFGCMRGLKNAGDFAIGSNGGITGMLVITLLGAYVVCARQVGAFKLLKRVYSAGIIVLVACAVLQRLAPHGGDPWYSIAFYADFFALFMVLWLLLAYVAHENETDVLTVFGLAFLLCGAGMTAGWLTGVLTHRMLGGDRVYISIALGCMVAVFCTVGFSPRSFPRLTVGGEGAKKLARAEEPATVGIVAANIAESAFGKAFAQERGLSQRELEVVNLMRGGHSPDFIANKLCISYNTVRTHIRNIYAKLGVHSRDGLVDLVDREERAYAKRNGEVRDEGL